MNKVEKPTLSGTRLKARKRDEKEKYEPNVFRDAIIKGLNETDGNLEKVSKFLDVSGSRLNYRRYADVLFDVLFAGGILAPGGFIVEDAVTSKPCRTDVCLFKFDASDDNIQGFYEVLFKLIRRYKYLEKPFEEEVRKILLFQKGFEPDQRQKLSAVTGHILAKSLASPRVLEALFEEHLVKEGLSLECASQVFAAWLRQRDVKEVFSALKKVHVESRLEELFPSNKRNMKNMAQYFRERDLGAIADVMTSSMATKAKKEAQKTMTEMIGDNTPICQLKEFAQDLVKKRDLTETEVTITIWNTVMLGVEWNKKEELLADQALKHLASFTPLLTSLALTSRVQLALMLKVQDYCYDNMAFLKSFSKIIILLYQRDVLTEQVIQHWFNKAHGPKGKNVFLNQLKNFVEWLDNAEEESDEEN